MSSQEADRELYYQLMDRIEDEERETWQEALEPVLNLERELLGDLPEDKVLLYASIVSALSDIGTARMVLLEAHAFNSGRSIEDLSSSEIQHHLSEVKAASGKMPEFLREHRFDSEGLGSPLETFV